MDAADAARLTEVVTGAVADAVKRGESYSSLENFLTDESVERMTEAVIEEAAETLGLADADDTGVNEKKLGDSRVAALKDMAKESLTEQFRKDGELRDTAERVRQKRREGAIRSDRIIERFERGEPNDYLDGISLERYGNSVIIPAEYGTIYPDGKRYPVVVGPYGEVKRINKQLGLPNTQAHHVAQNAIYGKTVPKQQGVAAHCVVTHLRSSKVRITMRTDLAKQKSTHIEKEEQSRQIKGCMKYCPVNCKQQG